MPAEILHRFVIRGDRFIGARRSHGADDV